MDAALPKDDSLNLDPQAMLTLIKTRARPWHVLGQLIQTLGSRGINSDAVQDATGVPRSGSSLQKV